MKTIDQMCAKYQWRLRNGAVPRPVQCSVEQHIERFRMVREHDRYLTTTTRQVLESLGVPTTAFFYYYAFTRRLDRLCRTYTSAVLRRAAQDLVDLWEARGLNCEILLTICEYVFDIPLSLRGALSLRSAQAPRRGNLAAIRHSTLVIRHS